MKAQNIALVTDSSSGIGYETSLMLARNGFLTYATMRNLDKAENIETVATKESLPIRVRGKTRVLVPHRLGKWYRQKNLTVPR
jgi:NAD(P)-dependent dehydrogenase (short-subunit alcohol dehydrogenase family)